MVSSPGDVSISNPDIGAAAASIDAANANAAAAVANVTATEAGNVPGIDTFGQMGVPSEFSLASLATPGRVASLPFAFTPAAPLVSLAMFGVGLARGAGATMGSADPTAPPGTPEGQEGPGTDVGGGLSGAFAPPVAAPAAAPLTGARVAPVVDLVARRQAADETAERKRIEAEATKAEETARRRAKKEVEPLRQLTNPNRSRFATTPLGLTGDFNFVGARATALGG